MLVLIKEQTAVGNGTVLHSSIAYNGSSFVSTPLKNYLQNNLANRKAIVGALSENESSSGSQSALSISLDIKYTRPASPVPIGVKNDMHGYNGGYVGVGINAPAVSVISPATVNAYEKMIL